MKIAGYIFAAIGGLALIGGLAAGHSVFGPLFWLALGIVLIYFGNKKEEKQQTMEKNDIINQQPTKAEKSMSPSKNETQEIITDKPMTYWKKYQSKNSSIAKSISSQVNMDFDAMTDSDVKETIASVERMASKLNCDVSVIKKQYLKEITKYPVEMLPEIIASTSREMENEAKMYGISKNNTMTSIMVRWLQEQHNELGKTAAKATKATSTGIDRTAQNIVSAFKTENAQMLKEETKEMLRQIKYHESMFSIVKQPFLVAKSLYFMLTEDYLSEENQMAVIKLTYFCLLNNFLKNCNCKPFDAEYEELVSGCKLALVLISMQNQYLMYSVIAGQAGYVNPDSHIRNQVLLFGGIAKEAEIAHCNFPMEDIIKKYYTNIFKELNNHLPTGKDLAIFKEKCIPVIKNLTTHISVNLDDRWSDVF